MAMAARASQRGLSEASTAGRSLAKTGRRRARRRTMAAEQALERAVEIAIEEVCAMVEKGESQQTATGIKLRRAFVTIMHSLPITCQTCFRVAKQHDAFEMLLFYERVRSHIARPNMFMSGVPAAVQLFVGASAPQPSDEYLTKTRFCDATSDRLRLVAQLESMDAEEKRARIQQAKANFAASVPGPVCVFVSECRAMAQGLRRVRGGKHFAQCKHACCQRLFFVGAGSDPGVEQTNEQADYSENSYWEEAGLYDGEDPEPKHRLFCSHECAKQYSDQIAALFEDASVTLDADSSLPRASRGSRVEAAFKKALKRNEQASRVLRSLKARRGLASAVTSSDIAKHSLARTAALNIDLAILHAASIVAESDVIAKGKLLPGSSANWREKPMYYSKPLASVSRIYHAHSRRGGIISSILTMPKFIEQVGSRAVAMF